jgi:hypothetical protein
MHARPLPLALSLACLWTGLVMGPPGFAQSAPPADASPPVPSHPIVGGKKIQPTPGANQQASGTKDLPPDQAKEVDDLYRQLINGPTRREELANQCKVAGTC